jgi:hypothetical protein
LRRGLTGCRVRRWRRSSSGSTLGGGSPTRRATCTAT